jgi:hypothetical protein
MICSSIVLLNSLTQQRHDIVCVIVDSINIYVIDEHGNVVNQQIAPYINVSISNLQLHPTYHEVNLFD